MKKIIELCKQLEKFFEIEACGANAVYLLCCEEGNQRLTSPQKSAIDEFTAEVTCAYETLQKKLHYIIGELEEILADDGSLMSKPELRLLKRIREDIRTIKLPNPQRGDSATVKDEIIKNINTFLK